MKLEDGHFQVARRCGDDHGWRYSFARAPRLLRGSIPWLTPKDMRGDYIWETEEHITEEAISKSATKLVSADSILVVVKSKALMHRLPIAVAKVAMCHGQDIKSIQCRDGPSRIHPLRAQVPRAASSEAGAWSKHRRANSPDAEELPVPDVEVAEQTTFANLVARTEELRGRQRETLRQARHLFESLLHEAFPAPA